MRCKEWNGTERVAVKLKGAAASATTIHLSQSGQFVAVLVLVPPWLVMGNNTNEGEYWSVTNVIREPGLVDMQRVLLARVTTRLVTLIGAERRLRRRNYLSHQHEGDSWATISDVLLQLISPGCGREGHVFGIRKFLAGAFDLCKLCE